MPTEFLMETTAKNELNPAGNSSRGSVRLRMAYGGSGRRVSKTRERKTETGDWVRESVTHYTGIGTEVRENYSEGSFQDARVIANMPHGLGRYGVSNEQPNEFYLKNHLGSTMLVYATGVSADGSIKAAYDYRAFGEQVDLMQAEDKVTENFTGKERDDETELNYFGARYLDPMIGLWISVDPKRQFASPYLYAGNGYNSINSFDPDGNEVELKNEQTTLLGHINSASYDQYVLDGNTLVEGSTCYEKGNSYFSERMNAAIYSDNLITAEINPNDKNAITLGGGVTYMNGNFGAPGANARIVLTGLPYGKSSAAQNTVHEFVSHAIPFILGDRKPNASAVGEEKKAIDGVFPTPEGVGEHIIYEE